MYCSWGSTVQAHNAHGDKKASVNSLVSFQKTEMEKLDTIIEELDVAKNEVGFLISPTCSRRRARFLLLWSTKGDSVAKFKEQFDPLKDGYVRLEADGKATVDKRGARQACAVFGLNPNPRQATHFLPTYISTYASTYFLPT